MLRKGISIICYIVAGFFVYVVSLLAFVNLSFLPSGNKPPLWLKYAIVGGLLHPGSGCVSYRVGPRPISILEARCRHRLRFRSRHNC